MTTALTLNTLHNAVVGGVAAIRSRSRLQPAGGPGDKVFPPTYATGDRALKYAQETRRVNGEDVPCVLLDSVASQANRMEEALQRAWEDHQLPFPVIGVDFTDDPDLADLDSISTLQAPHRIYDALLRDGITADGTLFRDSDIGKSITDATVKNATPLYSACPTALVFGAWDSTGPRGGLGTKFQRALVSEVVAIHAKTGVKVSSRLDPAGIQANVEVYHRKDNPDDYTLDAAQAQLDKKKKPALFGGKGKPSAVNHSNVTPSIDEWAGGITFDYAEQLAVLSLPALRRLRFRQNTQGETLEGKARRDAEVSARTALAALALAGMATARETGFDLRSRCALVPESAFSLELVPAEGGEGQTFTLNAAQAMQLLTEAHEAAKKHGFVWQRVPITLKPAPKLAQLIKRSRELAAANKGQDDGDK